MSEPKLTYGLSTNTNRLVYINDAERGLACQCKCPNPDCGAVLEAVKGNIRVPHFRHSNGADCEGARMTALHRLAQEIFEEDKRVMLPEYRGKYIVKPSHVECFDSVVIEKKIDNGRIIDCVGLHDNTNQNGLFVEILVTHEVDEEKRKDIRDVGARCVEINLSPLLNTDYTKSIVQNRLFESCNDRVWINCPEYTEEDRVAGENALKLERQRLESEKLQADLENQKRLEKEKERAERYQRRTARIPELERELKTWMTTGDNDRTQYILKILRIPDYQDPFKQCVQRMLLSEQNDFIYFIKKTSKTQNTLRIFYEMLHWFGYRYISFNALKSINEHIERYNAHDSLSDKGKIVMEEFVSLKANLLIEDMELRKKYTIDNGFRTDILCLMSLKYKHIVGCLFESYEELSQDVCDNHHNVLFLYHYYLSHFSVHQDEVSQETMLKLASRATDYPLDRQSNLFVVYQKLMLLD